MFEDKLPRAACSFFYLTKSVNLKVIIDTVYFGHFCIFLFFCPQNTQAFVFVGVYCIHADCPQSWGN